MPETLIHVGDVLDVLPKLPARYFSAVCTSPPYFAMRDYGVPETSWPEIIYQPLDCVPPITVPAMRCCLGLEPTPAEYVAHLVHIFRAVRRTLNEHGTLWLVMGDCFATNPGNGRGRGERATLANGGANPHRSSSPRGHCSRQKNLLGIPWRVALALQADGWILRADNVWHKPNGMPESMRDRTTRAHEYIFVFSQRPRAYFWNADAVREEAVSGHRERPGEAQRGGPAIPPGASPHTGLRKPQPRENGRNLRSVWSIPTAPTTRTNHATFPPRIPELCVLAATSEGGVCVRCFRPWKRNHAGAWAPNCSCLTHTGEPMLMPAVVLDPFGGTGTTAIMANRHHRNAHLIEINPAAAVAAQNRVYDELGTVFNPVSFRHYKPAKVKP